MPLAKETKGYQDYVFSIWIGVQTTAQIPSSYLKTLHSAAYAAFANPEVRKAIEASGTVLAPAMSLEELDRFYGNEARKAEAIAKAIKLEAQ